MIHYATVIVQTAKDIYEVTVTDTHIEVMRRDWQDDHYHWHGETRRYVYSPPTLPGPR